MTTHSIGLIYAGGTFGSFGRPLAPLATNILIPNLFTQLSNENVITNNALTVLENTCVKDSSTLTPADFVYFYQLILQTYKNGIRQFILITGTDTLSYLGAFLAEAFAGSDICIVLTASMKPFFENKTKDVISKVTKNLQVDKSSDAWSNIVQSISIAKQGKSGVYTCVSDDTWQAQSVQKIDSHALLAFSGNNQDNTYPANSYVKTLTKTQKNDWLTRHNNLHATIRSYLTNVQVSVVYAVPNNTETLITQLNALLDDTNPSAVIIMGFGAGNIAESSQLATLFEQKSHAGHVIIATTQCPFGGVSSAYAAGSWQYAHQVLSGNKLTVAAIYARLLWLLLTIPLNQRRQTWLDLSTK